MTLRRVTLALAPLTLMTSLASAAPGGSPAAPPPAAVAAAVATDDLTSFDKELDTLFISGGITADEAAVRSAKASPAVRRKAAEVDDAIASAEQTELQRVPQLTAKLSYTRLSYLAPVVLPVGGMNFDIAFLQNSTLAEVALVVPLSDYLLRYPKLIEAAHLGEQVAQVSKRSSEIDAGQDGRLAYYEWLRARLQVLIAQRQLVQVQATLVQVHALADAQRLSKADLLRVESQEAEAEQTVDQLRNLSDLREEQLRLLIGAPTEEHLALGEDVRTNMEAPAPAKLDDLMQHAISKRLDLRVLDLGIQARDKQRISENANQYPKVSAFATVDDANPNQRVFPQSDTFTLTWLAGAQITWTLGDSLISGQKIRGLVAQTDELRADRETLLRGARIEVLSAQQAVALAKRAFETSQKGLEASEEGYRVRKELLAADRATAVELVDAETDLTRARISALNARVDLRVALAQLAHALGDDVK